MLSLESVNTTIQMLGSWYEASTRLFEARFKSRHGMYKTYMPAIIVIPIKICRLYFKEIMIVNVHVIDYLGYKNHLRRENGGSSLWNKSKADLTVENFV